MDREVGRALRDGFRGFAIEPCFAVSTKGFNPLAAPCSKAPDMLCRTMVAAAWMDTRRTASARLFEASAEEPNGGRIW